MYRILFFSEEHPVDLWTDKTSTFPKQAIKAVVAHLKAGKVHGETRPQQCQLCGMEMPPLEMSDGAVIWPAMSQHYVVAHHVWSPHHVWLAERLLLQTDTSPPPLTPETSMSEDSSDSDNAWDVDLIEPSSSISSEPVMSEPDVLDILDVTENTTKDAAEEGKVEGNPWELSDTTVHRMSQSHVRSPSSPRPRSHRRSRRPIPLREARLPEAIPVNVSEPHASPMDTAARITEAYPMVSHLLATKIVSVAHAVGSAPEDLANIIWFETNQTFDPSIQNPRTGAVGLIQFDPIQTPHDLGITTEKLARLTAIQQMDWVQVKLDRSRNGRPLNAPHKLAMAIVYPPGISMPPQQPFHPSVVEANNGISSAVDYLSRVAAVARLPGSVPYPPPYVPPVPTSGSEPEGGIFDGVLGLFKNLFGGPPAPSSPPPGASQVSSQASSQAFALPGPTTDPSRARFATDAGLHVRLVDAHNTSHGPGDLPPGNYRIAIWTGSVWHNLGHLELVAGQSYHAREVNGKITIDPT